MTRKSRCQIKFFSSVVIIVNETIINDILSEQRRQSSKQGSICSATNERVGSRQINTSHEMESPF